MSEASYYKLKIRFKGTVHPLNEIAQTGIVSNPHDFPSSVEHKGMFSSFVNVAFFHTNKVNGEWAVKKRITEKT